MKRWLKVTILLGLFVAIAACKPSGNSLTSVSMLPTPTPVSLLQSPLATPTAAPLAVPVTAPTATPIPTATPMTVPPPPPDWPTGVPWPPTPSTPIPLPTRTRPIHTPIPTPVGSRPAELEGLYYMADNNGKSDARVIGVDNQGRKWSESSITTDQEISNAAGLYPSPNGKYFAMETFGMASSLLIMERSSGRVWCPFDKPEWCVGGFSGWMHDNRFLFRAGQGDRPKDVILGGVLVVDLATGQYRQLELPTSSDGVYSTAANVSLNPDDTRLAYSVTYPENGKESSEIWTMRIDGQNKQLIRKLEGGGITLLWSPAGTQLVYLYQPGTNRPSTDPYELWLLNSDGTGEKLLTRGQCYGPAWSPDNRHVAFVQADNLELYFSDWRKPGTNIYVVDTITGQITQLSSFKGRNNSSPTWSPDGKFVAFVSVNPIGKPEMYDPGLIDVEVWAASVDGSQLRAVSGMARWGSSLAWLPTGFSAQGK